MMKRAPFAGGNNWLGVGGFGLCTLIFTDSALCSERLGIFLMRQFMIGIPDDLLDAPH